MTAVNRVHHTGVVVRSLEESYVFFRETLGLRVVREAVMEDQGVKAALLDLGNGLLELLEPIERIMTAAKAQGVGPGIHYGSSAYARRMIELGFQLVTLLSDQRLMAAAAKAIVEETRGAGAGKQDGGSY